MRRRCRSGSFYSEPGGVARFAETKADPVLVYITGNGPTDTRYLQDATDSPQVMALPREELLRHGSR